MLYHRSPDKIRCWGALGSDAMSLPPEAARLMQLGLTAHQDFGGSVRGV